MTQAAKVFAVAIGSAFEVVGVLESPKAVTISLMPAAAYLALTDDL